MAKVYLSVRDEKGRMRSIDPDNVPQDVTPEVRAAAEALRSAMQPKRGRGRPAGYKCSAATIRKMVESRQATLAARKAQQLAN